MRNGVGSGGYGVIPKLKHIASLDGCLSTDFMAEIHSIELWAGKLKHGNGNLKSAVLYYLSKGDQKSICIISIIVNIEVEETALALRM